MVLQYPKKILEYEFIFNMRNLIIGGEGAETTFNAYCVSANGNGIPALENEIPCAGIK
jgi:hypothetical protein